MYFFKHEIAAEMFEALSFPAYVIYPLAIAKILGIIAIWTNKSKMLKEWAYAGFVFVFLLAISGHISAGVGEFYAPLIALILTLVSYSIYRIESNGDSKTVNN